MDVAEIEKGLGEVIARAGDQLAATLHLEPLGVAVLDIFRPCLRNAAQAFAAAVEAGDTQEQFAARIAAPDRSRVGRSHATAGCGAARCHARRGVLMFQRQQPGAFYAYPEHRPVWRRILWRLGYDPLTVRERLRQVDTERQYWKELAGV
ncbi:hypothetical protein [Nocardia sp. NPDC049149]|uniref:hypothetical protein n=1 Tax=Nocardia sp. NPDC049149 TaxID=3364315 RepID=UPI0037222767